MAMVHTNSLNYDMSGRRRKQKRGIIRGKYKSEFKEWKPQSSISSERSSEAKRYPSCTTSPTKTDGRKKESQQYTGDYVIGIATMHKSNAVPVTNKKYATEISEMIS